MLERKVWPWDKALKDRKEYLETAIAEVEMRAQMKLMLEYKEGKHLSWDPDAIINEYHATFPDLPASSPEYEPHSPPDQNDNANVDDTAGNPPSAWTCLL